MSTHKIPTVEYVDITLLKSNPPKLRIIANGRVPTAGWSNPQLSPYVYIQPPDDGIYDFDFVAKPPSGPAIQIPSVISASLVLDSLPAGMRGVRIHASSNSRDAVLGGGGSSQRKVCVKGVLTDEGVECQAMRTDAGELYTLVGNLKRFTIGDTVYISGTIAQISFCMQGITIAVDWISKTAPKAVP